MGGSCQASLTKRLSCRRLSPFAKNLTGAQWVTSVSRRMRNATWGLGHLALLHILIVKKNIHLDVHVPFSGHVLNWYIKQSIWALKMLTRSKILIGYNSIYFTSIEIMLTNGWMPIINSFCFSVKYIFLLLNCRWHVINKDM